MPGVVEVHDLHVWQVTSGYPAMSAHVLVAPSAATATRCAGRSRSTCGGEYAIEHTTLQVDHTLDAEHCVDSHGASYKGSG